jgi:hypothetical protein
LIVRAHAGFSSIFGCFCSSTQSNTIQRGHFLGIHTILYFLLFCINPKKQHPQFFTPPLVFIGHYGISPIPMAFLPFPIYFSHNLFFCHSPAHFRRSHIFYNFV